MLIRPEKIKQLKERMQHLGILEEDLQEKFILGSGKGGQKIQKSHSCVYLKHLPSGLEVKCQKERSRELNRYYARKLLCEKWEGKQNQGNQEKKRLQNKIRKQKQRRSRKMKAKLVEQKRKLSKKKQSRQSPSQEE